MMKTSNSPKANAWRKMSCPCARFPFLTKSAALATLGFLLAAGSPLVAATGNWTATSSGGDGVGNWTEGGFNNWGLGVGTYPGQTLAGDIANITGGNVTLNSNLPQSLATVTMSGSSTLNVSANLQTTANVFQVFNGSSVIVNQTAGTWSMAAGVNTPNIYLGGSAVASTGTNTWNISGSGSLDLTGNNFTSFNLGYAANTNEHLGTSTLNISGQGSIQVGRAFRMVMQSSLISIDASGGATFRQVGGTTGNDGLFMSANTAAPTVAYNSTVAVTGYNASTVLDVDGTFGAFQASAGLGNTATVEFTFSNNANGVNAWTTNILNLGNTGVGNVKGDLDVDVSLLSSDGTIAFTLFNYTTLQNGTFGSVSVNYGATELTLGTFNGLLPNNGLAQNEYFLAYGDGSSDSIRLFYNVVPEPSTWVLLAGSLTVLSVFRRRRS